MTTNPARYMGINYGRLIGTTISSPRSDYEVEDLLGSGGFGYLLLCRKKLTNETVALKVIKNAASIEFAKEEVRILKALNAVGSEDFHIVTLNDAFVFECHYCLEFKKLDMNLFQYMAVKSGRLSLKEIRSILHQMVEALVFLESRGIVHFDVKPENVMMVDHLHEPLKIELIDFGCAHTSSQLTKGLICGTKTYMAPEMLVGAACNRSLDMWSLGCVAAELLTGFQLFKGNTYHDVIRNILNTIGMLPDHVLSTAVYTKQHFNEESTSEQSRIWTLKCDKDEPQSQMQKRRLDVILKVSHETTERDRDALERDRKAFVDLVTKMLHVDPVQRITPKEAMEHPFLTLSHLNRNRHRNYVKLSEAMNVCDNKRSEETGSPTCTAISDSSPIISSEEPRIHPDATHRRRKRSQNSTDSTLPFSYLFFAVFVFFALTKLLVPFLTGSRPDLLFTGQNISQPDFDNCLIPLEFPHNPVNVGLTDRPDWSKKKRKGVKQASLPAGGRPTVLNWFLDIVWSVVIKMDEIRLKTTDHCMNITKTWRNKRPTRITVKITSYIVVGFILIMWDQSSNI